MISAASFWTHSLHAALQGESISRILASAIRAVEPGEAVRRTITRTGILLNVAGRDLDLSAFGRVFVLGFGKASLPMANALVGLLGPQLTGGLVITKQLPEVSQSPFIVLQGGHPVPDERSLNAGASAIELLSSLRPDDLLLCLVSGGGSALMTMPVEGVTLPDLQSLTSELLACGAGIDEINTLRRHLDQLKGGGLVNLARGAYIVSLILSDVIGDPLEAIASGPTAPDPSSLTDALDVIEKYGLDRKIPASIPAALGARHETFKPGAGIFDNVQNIIIGSNLLAAQAALRQAKTEGFRPYLLRTDLHGEAREAAFDLATFLRQASQTGNPVSRPFCIVAGGETTVTIHGKGMGGRNMELALAAVSELAGFPAVMLITLATDGEDGTTDAAGAVVTGESHQRATALGLLGSDYLSRNDSYRYFAALNDLLKPGPTGTNVNDLVFLFAF